MEIFTLKIKKGRAGKTFPFDRVYLVKYSDRELIEKLFRHALVMPIEGVLRELILENRPEEYIDHTIHRDDEALETQEYRGEWTEFVDRGMIMVVPILTKWMNAAMPKYLMNLQWYEGRKAADHLNAGTPLPAMTYLQTPGKKIRPVCVACPRFIEHQNGDCHLGQRVCYESLPLGLNNYFETGLGAPPPSRNVKESDVDVQEDHP
jgi:hypothetical protein